MPITHTEFAIVVGIILFLVHVLQALRISSLQDLTNWQAHELNKVHALADDAHRKIDAFTAGHVHITDKPERTPGMP